MAHLSRDVQRIANKTGNTVDNIVKGTEKILGAVAAAKGILELGRGAYAFMSTAAPIAASVAPLAAAL